MGKKSYQLIFGAVQGKNFEVGKSAFLTFPFTCYPIFQVGKSAFQDGKSAFLTFPFVCYPIFQVV